MKKKDSKQGDNPSLQSTDPNVLGGSVVVNTEAPMPIVAPLMNVPMLNVKNVDCNEDE